MEACVSDFLRLLLHIPREIPFLCRSHIGQMLLAGCAPIKAWRISPYADTFFVPQAFHMFNCPFNRDYSGKCPMGARRDYRQQHPWVSCKVTTTAPPSCWSLLPRRWAIARCGFPLVAGLFLTDRLGQFSINEGVSLFGGGVHSGR